jgi:hypothetical protein
MKTVLASAALSAIVGAAASADVTYSFTNQTYTGFNFSLASAAGTLQGTLTGASINVTLNASTSYTYADDLCVYVGPNPIAMGGALQCGGYSSLNAGQRYYWPNGGSSAPGTTSVGTVNFSTPLNFSGSASDYTVWLGNGYGASGTSGTWTGSVTLIGVNQVPAPGALALLGLAGLASRRRR